MAINLLLPIILLLRLKDHNSTNDNQRLVEETNS